MSKNSIFVVLTIASLSAAACTKDPCQELGNRKDELMNEFEVITKSIDSYPPNHPKNKVEPTITERLENLSARGKELDKSEIKTKCDDKIKTMSKDEKINYICSLKGNWAKEQCNIGLSMRDLTTHPKN